MSQTSESSGGEGIHVQGANSALINNGDVILPFYIHPSDNPGQIFVADLLHDGNYGEWVSDMTNALYAKNKIGFVDRTLIRPTADSPNLNLWIRVDAMVKSWLKSAMEKDVCGSVRYAKSAHKIWVDISERFGKGSAPRAYELQQEVTILCQEGSSVFAYYTKLKALWDEVQAINPLPRCSCSNYSCGLEKQFLDMRAKEQLYDCLMGLDEIFNTIKTQILSKQPLPSLGIAYHIVSKDEQQCAVSNLRRVTDGSVAFQTSQNTSQLKGFTAGSGTSNKKGGDNRP